RIPFLQYSAYVYTTFLISDIFLGRFEGTCSRGGLGLSSRAVITLNGIEKTFKVARRAAGFKEAVKALFAREYSHVEALKDISFTINEGEIVGYIGPNGAGKSTTIKVMSGILVPDAGSCSVLGYTPWQE